LAPRISKNLKKKKGGVGRKRETSRNKKERLTGKKGKEKRPSGNDIAENL